MSLTKEEAAGRFSICIYEGKSILETLDYMYQVLHYKPAIVNEMMDDFYAKYNSSPLEFHDNLEMNKDYLLECLEGLYEIENT